ncbi:zinc finger HIT domain-containing protein [Chloropicon primus]|uniref:Zinc finger HIT domain-containing protein n=2 Tax=Chloropicon primus TaxID=1764295 RepID=A0A5B8MGD8_9CHLO|nr:zinc finger HIT domain-containing protein [Chloropicon primus]UPQ97613.1 zinc finger HIT domain-containing protein [Chloropicon primus]|eukprot:QDZ18402.1 zinc finger HIT domain-containing protein [Chloropicon primus]
MECQVCLQGRARYACPRCGTRYCTLACYRGHSSNCVDAFYRESVEEDLKGTRVSDEGKGEMVEILKRVHESSLASGSPSEGEEGEDGKSYRHLLSDETVEALSEAFSRSADAGDEDIDLKELQKLMGSGEFQSFSKAALAGELSHLIREEEPWWHNREALDLRCSADGTSLVKILVVADDTEGGGGVQGPEAGRGVAGNSPGLVPPLPSKSLPPLSQFTRKPPSEDLCWHLVDILYAYCFVHRMRNSHFSSGQARAQAGEEVFMISNVLQMQLTGLHKVVGAEKKETEGSGERDAGGTGVPVLPKSAHQAISGCIGSILSQKSGLGYDCTPKYCASVAGDVSSVLGCGKAAVLCALEEVRVFMVTAKKKAGSRAPKGKTQDHSPREAKAKQAFRLLAQKIQYFLSWANEQCEKRFEDLSLAVNMVSLDQGLASQVNPLVKI